jgi:hypothetical protein
MHLARYSEKKKGKTPVVEVFRQFTSGTAPEPFNTKLVPDEEDSSGDWLNFFLAIQAKVHGIG